MRAESEQLPDLLKHDTDLKCNQAVYIFMWVPLWALRGSPVLLVIVLPSLTTCLETFSI